MTADRDRVRTDRRSFLRTSGLAALGLAAAPALASCSSGDDAQLEDDNLGFAGIVLGYPLAKPTVDFTDTSGTAFNFVNDTKDHLSLALFGYTSCPDVCPVHLNILASTLAKLSGPVSKTKVIFIGVDTKRDTPEVLRTYLDKRDRDFIGLTAAPEVIDEALKQLKLPSVIIDPPTTPGDDSYVVEHPSQILCFTPDNECHIVYPSGVVQQDWTNDLPRLMTYDWPVTAR